LVFVAGDDAVEALDDELLEVVADVGRVAAIAQAADDALGEADAVIELAQGDEAGIGSDLTALKIEADLAILAEGECGLVSHCAVTQGPPGTALWLATTLFRRPCRFASLAFMSNPG